MLTTFNLWKDWGKGRRHGLSAGQIFENYQPFTLGGRGDKRCRKGPIWTNIWHLYPFTLQTHLDLYDSELALASSPVLFWNLCVQSEIWISIVICGLAAVVGQASKNPPPSSYVTAASCPRAPSAPLYPTLPVSPLITVYISLHKRCKQSYVNSKNIMGSTRLAERSLL